MKSNWHEKVRLFPQQIKRFKDRYEYPHFGDNWIKHESLNSVTLPRVRPNYVYIRIYRPAGFTRGGLYVEKGTKFPPIWGHVLAFSPNVQSYLGGVFIDLGDQVLFKRFSNEHILDVPAGDPLYPGELLDVQLIHVDNIQAVFKPTLVEMRK